MKGGVLLITQDDMSQRLALRPREAALMLGVSPRLIYEMMAAGEIPAMRVRSRWVIPKDEFLAWFKAGGRVGRK